MVAMVVVLLVGGREKANYEEREVEEKPDL